MEGAQQAGNDASNKKKGVDAYFTEVDEQKESDDGGVLYKTRPIAAFYPETTVMFADIAGFTAWSSTREPFQVFQLLETIYGAFDTIAKQRRVFKVETVGDCYVAVAGAPNAAPNPTDWNGKTRARESSKA